MRLLATMSPTDSRMRMHRLTRRVYDAKVMYARCCSQYIILNIIPYKDQTMYGTLTAWIN